MGKKIRLVDTNNTDPFIRFKSPEPIDRAQFAESDTFEGDSRYDEGLVAGIDQSKLRARNQPFTHELVNAALKTVPGIGLGIVENVGYLGELFSGDQNYDNLFTEIARKGREKLENQLPVYRKDNDVFSLGDTAWWINHGQGLAESVGEFLVTGAGIGGALSKSAKFLTQSLKAGKLGADILQGSAQLGTASLLSYTEGAMSGAQVYKDTYQHAKLYEGLSDEQANDLAANAAAKTVRLNTVLNTGLNITSLSPIFRSFNQLDDAVKLGLNRLPKEATTDYIKRLTLLEASGISKAGPIRKLALEAVQEGLEEDVNLFAEQEGYIEGGLKKTKGDYLNRFIDNTLSQEGALNFILGAVGGVAQTAGMEYLPFRTYTDDKGKIQRVSASTLEHREKEDYQKQTLATFRKDIETLGKYQDDLNTAVKKGDPQAIDEAKNNLFNIGLLKSLRNETSEALAAEVGQVAVVDNTNIGQDGKTDAVRMGFADNIDDNTYKETALQKATDIRALNKEYRDLVVNSKNPLQATEAFRSRLDGYAIESTIHNINKQLVKAEADVLSSLPDQTYGDWAKLNSEIKGYDIAINQLKKEGKSFDHLKNQQTQLKEGLKDLKGLNFTASATSDEHKLDNLYAKKLLLNEALIEKRKEYKELKSNPKALQNRITKNIEELTKGVKTAEKYRADKQREAEKAEAKQEAQEKVNLEQVERQKQEKIENISKQIKETKSPEEIPPILREAGEEANHPIVEQAIVNKNQELSNSEETPPLPPEPPIELYRGESTLALTQEKTNQVVANEVNINNNLDQTINDQLQQNNEPNQLSYGNYNRIAYKAQEQDKSGSTIDPFTINNIYKILHSPKFRVGTKLLLGVDHTSPFYEKNKDDVNNVPIVLFYSEDWERSNPDIKKVGYLPTYKFGMNSQLFLAREYIKKNTEVNDTITYKGTGVLNKGIKKQVSENYAYTPKFLIGRDGRFESSLNEVYALPLINTTSNNGVVYTLDKTPNGKEIALPVDVDKVAISKVDSTLHVLDLYFKGAYNDKKATLSDKEQEFILTLQDRFNFDPTKPADFRDYFEKIFHITNLTPDSDEGKANIEAIKDRTNDKYYIQAVAGGIKFIKSGDPTVTFYGRNDINNNEKTAKLREALLNSYNRVDLAQINSKGKFKLPILKDNLQVEEYSKNSYNEHVASITSTNIVSVAISDTEQTSFVQPNIYLGFSFLQNPEKSETVILPTGEKAVNLEHPKPKKGFKSLVTIKQEQLKKQPDDIVNKDDLITDEELVKRYKERCR